MSNQKVLITGATGFIGQALVSQLVKNYSVTCLIRNVKKADRLLPRKADRIVSTLGSVKFPSKYKFDIVVHSAANINLHGNKKELIQTNVVGTEKLIKELKNRCNLFVFLSTIETLNPKTWYGKSKKIAEKSILEIGKRTGLKIIILRLGNVTGHQNTFFTKQIRKNLEDQKGEIAYYYPLIKDKKLALLGVYQVTSTVSSLLKNKSSGIYTLVPKKFVTVETLVSVISKRISCPDFRNNKKTILKKIRLKVRLEKHKHKQVADLIDYLFNKADYNYLKNENIIHPSSSKKLEEIISETIKNND